MLTFIFLLFIRSMTQRPFAPITNEPFKVQNFYFQIIVAQLIPKATTVKDNARYTFSIFKGDRQFQTTKEVTVPQSTREPIALDKFKLNFPVTSYNPAKPHDFALRMILTIDSTHAKEVGEYIVDANQYINEYNITDNGAFAMTIELNDQFSAEVELYVDRNQHGLYRLIRDIKNPKPKKEEDFQAPVISHQRILERRRLMDQEAEQQKRQNSKDKRFSRFSPRKEDLEDKNKKNDFISNKKKREEEERKLQEEEEQRKKEENAKKNLKKEPVVKKEWIIPAAEKYLEKKKENQQKLKRKSSKESQGKAKAEETKTSSKVTRKKSTAVEIEPTLAEKLLSPKLLVPLLILIIAAGYMVYFRSSQQQIDPILPKEKTGKGQKGTRKGQAKVKSTKK